MTGADGMEGTAAAAGWAGGAAVAVAAEGTIFVADTAAGTTTLSALLARGRGVPRTAVAGMTGELVRGGGTLRVGKAGAAAEAFVLVAAGSGTTINDAIIASNKHETNLGRS